MPPSVTVSLSKIAAANKIVQFENQRSRCTGEAVPTEVKQSSPYQISIRRLQFNYPFRGQLLYLQLSFSSLLFYFTNYWTVMALKPGVSSRERHRVVIGINSSRHWSGLSSSFLFAQYKPKQPPSELRDKSLRISKFCSPLNVSKFRA